MHTFTYNFTSLAPLGVEVSPALYNDPTFPNGIAVTRLHPHSQVVQINQNNQLFQQATLQLGDQFAMVGNFPLPNTITMADFVAVLKQYRAHVVADPNTEIMSITFVRPPLHIQNNRSFVLEERTAREGTSSGPAANATTTTTTATTATTTNQVDHQPPKTNHSGQSGQDIAATKTKPTAAEKEREKQHRQAIKLQKEQDRITRDHERMMRDQQRDQQRQIERLQREQQRKQKEQAKLLQNREKIVLRSILSEKIELIRCMESYLNVLDGTANKHYASKASLNTAEQLGYDRYIAAECVKHPVITDQIICRIGQKWREDMTSEEKKTLGRCSKGELMFVNHYYASLHPPTYCKSPHKHWDQLAVSVGTIVFFWWK